MLAVSANQANLPLTAAVVNLRGVGSEHAAQLARLHIRTIEDLLLHRPRRYEDRRHFRPIAELELDQPATTRGTVVALGIKRYRKGQKSVFELILNDGTARLHCRWWNLPFMEKYFAVGNEVVVFGKPLALKPRTIDHPETEVVENGEENFIHLNRITPVYPLTEGLPQRWLRSLIWRTVERFESAIADSWPDVLSTALRDVAGGPVKAGEKPGSAGFRTAEELPSRARAIRLLHFPESAADIEIARGRLALDEFTALQLQIRVRRKRFEEKARALPCGGDNRLIKPFLAMLGFKLTSAQTAVLREIRTDLRGVHPMRRLLQGDVGSGKTVVAACAALMTIESGFDVALMVPTEILAEQHFRNFCHWFEPLGIGVALRTGSRKTSNTGARSASDASVRTANIARPFPSAAGGQPRTLLIGTHALLTPTAASGAAAGSDLRDVGLVIIDEQHKFGVSQREQLVRKGRYPHLLVMTATPIPRTLGLTLYGDLDISTMDAPPPGRGRIKTFVRASDSLPRVWSFVCDRLREGRQAYVVYPRVESDSENVKAVTMEFETLQRTLAPFRVGLLHGRLKSSEKDGIMTAFSTNRIQVLLATSLVEVGIDVPNATLMLIENAEMFGLAQLHQLRGRIGRGAHESWCILVSAAKTEEALERLRVLEDSTDGFRIAEADLRLRGPGQLLGQEQSGLPGFRFGDLARDWEIVQLARLLAGRVAAPHEMAGKP